MKNAYDIAIIGCGPAGLSAALNAHIRKKEIILFGNEFCTPKMHISPWVDNYLGEVHISGKELRKKFIDHIQETGINVTEKRIDAVYQSGEFNALQCGDQLINAKTVIIATGVSFGKKLEGEEEFVGKGVSYCATCDGLLFKDKIVAMLAYSREGLDEIKFLADVCKEVILFPLFKGEVPSFPPNVKVEKTSPTKINGNGMANSIIIEKGEIPVDGVFIFREAVPPAQLVPGVEIDAGAIKVNKNMETNLPGIFAAGDCTGKPFQLSKASGEGQIAALNAVHYIDTH